MCHRGRANKTLLVAKESLFRRRGRSWDGYYRWRTIPLDIPRPDAEDDVDGCRSSREPKAKRAHRFPRNYERFILRKSSGSTKRRSRAINAITPSNKHPFRKRNDNSYHLSALCNVYSRRPVMFSSSVDIRQTYWYQHLERKSRHN